MPERTPQEIFNAARSSRDAISAELDVAPAEDVPPAGQLAIPPLKWAVGTIGTMAGGEWYALSLHPCADKTGASPNAGVTITVYLWEEVSQTKAVTGANKVVGYMTDSNGENIAIHFAKEIYYAGS
jgi:hypothetical protein